MRSRPSLPSRLWVKWQSRLRYPAVIKTVLTPFDRHAQGRLLGEILGELLVKLGAPNSALRSLAYVQASWNLSRLVHPCY